MRCLPAALYVIRRAALGGGRRFGVDLGSLITASDFVRLAGCDMKPWTVAMAEADLVVRTDLAQISSWTGRRSEQAHVLLSGCYAFQRRQEQTRATQAGCHRGGRKVQGWVSVEVIVPLSSSLMSTHCYTKPLTLSTLSSNPGAHRRPKHAHLQHVLCNYVVRYNPPLHSTPLPCSSLHHINEIRSMPPKRR